MAQNPEEDEIIETPEEENNEAVPSFGESYLESMAAKLLEQETSKEIQAIKLQILRRIAAESDIKPARIPAPMNITEIGGYFNLMMKMKQEEEKRMQEQIYSDKQFSDMIKQTLTSILGLPVQAP